MKRTEARDWLNNDYSGQKREYRRLSNDKLIVVGSVEYKKLVLHIKEENDILLEIATGGLGFSPNKKVIGKA